MKTFKKVILLSLTCLLVIGLGACSKQPTKSVKDKTTSSAKSQSSKKRVPKTASLKGQTFQTKQGTFVLSENHVSASATKNKQVLILKYTFRNTGKTQLVPSDDWYRYIKATQNINDRVKKLEQGSLPFSTTTTPDDKLENASVSEVKPGHTIQAEASWQLAKNGSPVTLKFYDTHHQLVGTRHYATN